MTPKQERILERLERMVREIQSTSSEMATIRKCMLDNAAELVRADKLVGQLRERAEAAEQLVVLLTDSQPVRPETWTDENEQTLQGIWDRAIAHERAPKEKKS